MKRRSFIVGIAGATAWSRLLLAQAKMPVIGLLVTAAGEPAKQLEMFQQAMGRLGYVDGQTLRVEFRFAEAAAPSLDRLASELATSKVDVIVAWLTPAARAAARATKSIPIVMSAGDPVAAGLVASLDHPGGNITGTGSFTPQLAGKNIELLRELLPAARKLVALCNETDTFTPIFLESVRAAALDQSFDLEIVNAAPSDVEAAFKRL
jgi:putative tryptophan/tyrosine transport system substrate-binding protein